MDKSQIFGIVIFLALLVVFVPVIYDFVAIADDQRGCTDEAHPYECIDNDDGLINWCSNESEDVLHCVAPRPIYNVTTALCTNASGVRVTNSTQITSCDSNYWADGIVPYNDIGLSVVEVALMGLIVLFLVLSVVFMALKGLNKQV